MDNKPVRKIPYGVSDYGRIVEENYYYVDKTRYLKQLEHTGDYLFFIRPRRFGKSLFISMMKAYYDRAYKERFRELFKGTWIYDNPTSEQGKYLVLLFNFSTVDPAPERLETAFLEYIRRQAVLFIDKYTANLVDQTYFKESILDSLSASDILSIICDLCKKSNQKLYIIIDEYDNFANTILSTSGKYAYQEVTRGEGFFRSFFNVLKAGTTDMEAPVTRLFITGVSPVTLDDVTSGFNIGDFVTRIPDLNRMLGFTGDEVTVMIDYYKSHGLLEHDGSQLLELLDNWYGNYRFSEYAEKDGGLYNSDMILYFFKEYFRIHNIPDQLIDRNVRVDYGKLKHLILVGQDSGHTPTSNGNFSKLKQIIEKGETSTQLVSGFPLSELTHPENFKSLLFYLGLLTIKGQELGEARLTIPNETVRRLFYDYIKRAYEETGVFSLDLSRYASLMKAMAAKAEWKPLMDYILERMSQSISLRDLITGEKSIQAFLNVYLGLSDLFIVHAEKEMNKGYADIVMEPFLARYEELKYSYLLEIKYMKAGAKQDDRKIQQLISEGEAQINAYALDEKYKKTIEKTTLIKLIAVFSGHRVMYLGEVK